MELDRLKRYPVRPCLACCELYQGPFCCCAKTGTPLRALFLFGAAAEGGLLAERNVPTPSRRIAELAIAGGHAARRTSKG